ncbi:type IV pilus modification PilV family protein [Tepidibacter sp. Z1-5]|uniref:type IV pilus modification PilV family protein n=1 Tax=Tepidibacter sp. Z1-5 TaxID=3134138 RepID=UPI0030C02E92
MIKSNKGLTLVELIVSLAILGIILVPLSSFFVNTIKVNKSSENQMIANQLAQKYMERVKFSDLDNSDSENIVLPDEEIIEDDNYKSFEIKKIVQEYEQNNKLVKITIKVKKKNDNHDLVELVGLRKID